MPSHDPRIALLGFHLETNAFAPVTTGEMFRASCWLEGEAMLAEAAKPAPKMPKEIPAFLARMGEAGPWTPVPILITGCEPGGPAEQTFYDDVLRRIREDLAAAGPLDAVYISNHGAAVSTGSADPDGDLYALVREAVGPDVPVVATIDLHANISETMVRSVDAIIAYRTNPHLDQAERAADAADLLRRMLGGERFAKAFIRMPIVPPPVKLVTASGLYGELIEDGQAAIGPDLAVVSVVGGFFRSDIPKNGLAIITYGRGGRPAQVARRLAERAWAERERFRIVLTPLDEAIALAKAKGETDSGPPILLADVADNPGSGGPGNTTDILEGLLRADVRRALLGNFVDPAVAAECGRRGRGASFQATLNAGSADPYARPVAVDLTVLAVSDGLVVGRQGIYAGRTVDLGPSAAVRIGGVTAVVVSRRIQCADPIFFETFGLRIPDFRTVVVKSLAHFRGGIGPFFRPEDIHEVDAGGITTPVQSRYAFKRLPRPIYPLDLDASFDQAKAELLLPAGDGAP